MEEREITNSEQAELTEIAASLGELSKTDKASIIGYINGIKDANRISAAIAAEKQPA